MLLRASEIREDNIGGAFVKCTFRRGTQFLRAGQHMTAQEVMSINHANRAALVDKGFIAVYPAAPKGAGHAVEETIRTERHPVHVGRGLYDVIEGRKLTVDPVSKEEAYKLAGLPQDN